MKNKLYYFSFLFIVFYICHVKGGTVKNNKDSFPKLYFAETIRTDSINRIHGLLKNGDRLDIHYENNLITINVNNLVITQIPYSIPDEVVLPCNGIAVKRKNKSIDYKEYYIYKDKLLLLPVFDFDGRINLFCINIKNGKTLQLNKPRKSQFLYTYLTWFVFEESKGVIRTFDSMDDKEKSLIHIFKVTDTEFLYIRSYYKKIGFDVFFNESMMKKNLEKMLK